MKSEVKELKVDYVALVEGSGKSSNFHNDIEAVVAAKKIIETPTIG